MFDFLLGVLVCVTFLFGAAAFTRGSVPVFGTIFLVLGIGLWSGNTEVQDIPRSEISYSKHAVQTERVVYVRHEKTSEEFIDPYVYEHVGDTARVDFKLEKKTNVWLIYPKYEVVVEKRVP